MNLAEACRAVPFLRELGETERLRLEPHMRLRQVARSEAIWNTDDASRDFTFLVDGRVKLVKTNEGGRETIVELCRPGDLLCTSAVCAFAPYCCSSLALDGPVWVLTIPRRDIFDLIERGGAAALSWMVETSGREARLTGRIEQLSSGHVERRVAALLCDLAERAGTSASGGAGTWIPIQLTRQDLADLCGTTVETAIRVMTRLSREGVVRSAARGLVILNREKLQEIARSI